MMHFLESLAYWHWVIAAFLCFGLELLVPGTFFFLSLGLGGIATAIVAALWSGMNWSLQGVVFAIFALATLFFTRKVLQAKEKKPSQDDLNQRDAGLIGQEFYLAEPIVKGRGRVKIGDGTWSVEGPELPIGTKIRVLKTKGAILVVEAVE